jgi:carbamoyl-phosphate synthase large subunit
VALMQGFANAMKELGVKGKLIATDITPASPAFQKADAGILVPPARRAEYLPSLKEVAQKHHIGLLVPLTDLDLRSLARHREDFAEFGCTVMIGSEDAVTLCRDKARTNELLGKAGLATINTLTMSEFRSSPFYPCFVKPISGSAGIGTAIIRNEKQLLAHINTYGELMIVQEYVPGQEYTVDVYRSRDGKVRCVVPRQRLLVRSGEVEKGITIRDPELMRTGAVLGSKLEGLWGVFCCQCRRSGNGPPRYFEINPRFGGGSPLTIAAGANLPLYLLQEVLGLPITAEMGRFTDRLLMLRYDEAVFIQVTESLDNLPGFAAPRFH